MTDYLDDEANTCHPDLRADVRKALSPVLGGRPYVIYVDCTSLDTMRTDEVDIHLITPEYQSRVTTRGVTEYGMDIQKSTYIGD